VLVVGGGPGGMEAARVAALRGHKVTLWEKSGELGGNLIPGSIPEFKSDIKDLIIFLSSQIKKLGIPVELNKEATPNLVKNANPDEVILATGATPIIPEILGYEKRKVCAAIDLLLGKRESGKRVIMIGGGFIGSETALWLAQRGKNVTIIDVLEDVMTDMFQPINNS
jgi:2-enoate reductase